MKYALALVEQISGRSDGYGEDVNDRGPIMLNEALELLSQRWDRINGAQALRLLPRDTKLQVFFSLVYYV